MQIYSLLINQPSRLQHVFPMDIFDGPTTHIQI
jgi:hypothetical protein